MIRKNLLTLLLTIGIVSNICLYSCSKSTVDPIDTFFFKYVNMSGKDAEIVIFIDDIEKGRRSILNNASFEEIFTMPKDDNQTVITEGDSVVLVFEELEISYNLTNQSEFNILNWDNYSYEVDRAKREHFLTYTFTVEDYTVAN